MHGQRLSRETLEQLIQDNDGIAVDIDVSHDRLSGENLSHMNLSGIIMYGCDLRGCLLIGAIFEGADLRSADFRPSPAGEQTNLEQADLQAARLEGAKLTRSRLVNANLRGGQLKGAKLIEAELHRADLTGANLEEADLSGAILDGADLSKAVLQGASLQGSSLKLTVFSDTKLDRESLGDRVLHEADGRYHDAKYIYLALSRNFREIGAYDAASWAFVRERTMERKTYFPPSARRLYYDREVPAVRNALLRLFWVVRFYLKFTWKWARAFLLGAFWGYGEKPLNALYLSAVSILAFAIFYSYLGDQFDSDASGPLAFKDYLLHSLGTFTATPFLEPVTPLAKIATSLQSISGITALAAFTSALGQRIGGR